MGDKLIKMKPKSQNKFFRYDRNQTDVDKKEKFKYFKMLNVKTFYLTLLFVFLALCINSGVSGLDTENFFSDFVFAFG